MAKLTDFGIAGILSATTAQIGYTLAHCPPETFDSGGDSRDERSDIYSAASTLYWLIEGRAPFAAEEGVADTQLAYMYRIIEQDPAPMRQDVPESLKAIIAEALARTRVAPQVSRRVRVRPARRPCRRTRAADRWRRPGGTAHRRSRPGYRSRSARVPGVRPRPDHGGGPQVTGSRLGPTTPSWRLPRQSGHSPARSCVAAWRHWIGVGSGLGSGVGSGLGSGVGSGLGSGRAPTLDPTSTTDRPVLSGRTLLDQSANQADVADASGGGVGQVGWSDWRRADRAAGASGRDELADQDVADSCGGHRPARSRAWRRVPEFVLRRNRGLLPMMRAWAAVTDDDRGSEDDRESQAPAPVAGSEVSIIGPEATPGEVEAIQAALDVFAERHDMTISYQGSSELMSVLSDGAARSADGEQGEVADIVIVAQQSVLLDLVEAERVVPLAPEIEAAVDAGWDSSWSATGRVGELSYAVPTRSETKSLVWYQPDRFAELGYEVPAQFGELEELTAEAAAAGDHPWCVGLGSAPDDGWPFTDWVEDYVLAVHGPDVYEEWVAGRIRFGDREVLEPSSGSVTSGLLRGRCSPTLRAWGSGLHRSRLGPRGCSRVSA